MKKHTPGPWSCDWTSNHAHDYRLTRPSGRPLPIYAPGNDHSQQRANARLIAAAPDLLEALDKLLAATVDEDLKYGITLTEAEEEARALALAAIAKTIGEDDDQ